jgi:hypothetical protein
MRKPHFVKLDKILTLHNDLFEKSKAQMHRIMDVLVI